MNTPATSHPRPAPPEVIAHRGANREAPENTLPAFEAAVALGADGIELDIQMTADGVPVVHHNATLPGSSQRPLGAAISSLAFASLRRETAVPSFDEVLEAVAGRCRLYVELKAPGALDTVLQKLRPHAETCAVHSFDHRVIARAAALAPRIPRGILLASYLMDPLSALRATGARDLWQHVDRVDDALIERAHGAGHRVIAWTANDPARARSLIELGIDGLCTDVAREMRALVDATN